VAEAKLTAAAMVKARTRYAILLASQGSSCIKSPDDPAQEVSWHDYPLTVREIAAFPACRSESQKQPSLSNFSRRAPAPTKDPASAWLAQKWHAAAPGPRQAGLPLDLAEELWGFTLDCGPNRRV
jgi:hypothetical protein